VSLDTLSLIRTQTIDAMRTAIAPARRSGQRIALVPTMGALHEGHLALVDEAHRRADVVVTSIFVNPLQFGPGEDLDKYPRTLDADLAALDAHHVTFVFTPDVDEMYANGRVTQVTAAPHDAAFEGAHRPGHFTGVLTVVTKLFNIVQPNVAVFGQKDLQQLSLIRRMVRDLNIPIDIVSLPTVRESDGLAMSSRNRYLSPDDRQKAAQLYQALSAARSAFTRGDHDAERLTRTARTVLAEHPSIVVDYLAVVDPENFSPVPVARTGTAIIIAARVGSTRLIDNLIL
jgi:pantoate--beta-alanine ligase